MNYTKPQQKAITTLQKNLVVTAGAGSGKTRVLVARYLEILKQQQATLGEILAITFTKKAASEMKARVRKAIEQELAASSKGEQDYWRTIKSEIELAQISTIHSLGLNILRQHPVQAQIDPNVSLLDEVRGPIELEKVVRETVLKATQADPVFKQFVTEYGGLQQCMGLVLRFYNKLRVFGGYKAEMLRPLEQYAQQAQSELSDCYSQLAECLTSLREKSRQSSSRSKFVAKWREAPVEQWLSRLKSLDSLNSYETSRFYQEIQDYCKRPVKELADDITRLYHHKTNQGLVPTYLTLLGLKDNLPLLRAVAGVLINIDDTYRALKVKHHWLDFADLELMLLKLFENAPEILQKYQQQYRFIMVDEFQDTNPLQQQLIRLLAPYEQQGLFIVGDAKQSIYRFRAAEVQGFLDMASEIVASQGEAIYLDINFRSNKPLVDFFNKFFSAVFAGGAISYDKVQGFREEEVTEAPVQLWLPHPEIVPPKLTAQEQRMLEAELIASRIATLNKQGFKYGDFALLFRAMTNVKIYERALQDKGIPYVVVGSRGFFERPEVLDCLNLLTYLHHPEDVLALIAVLRSPLFAISDEGIYWLQQSRKLKKLGECTQLEEQDQVAWQQACQKLRQWLAWRELKLPAETLDYALQAVNYSAVLLGSPSYGLQAQANVEKLLDFIYEIQQAGSQSWTEVLSYLNHLRQGDILFSEAPISAEDDNVVRLMSIHQAKGLEFPVVIVPEVQRSIQENRSDYLLYSPEQGMQLRSKDYYGNTWDNKLTEAILSTEQQLNRAESKRLLYVAATRAQKVLIFSAFPKKLKQAESWQDAQSWLEWLLLATGVTDFPKEAITLNNDIRLIPLNKDQAEDKLPLTPHRQAKTAAIALNTPLTGELRPKLTFSSTALLDFTQCPRLFYYRHVLKMPAQILQLAAKETEKEVDALLLGTLMHKLCEKVSDKQDIIPTWENILEATSLTSEAKKAYTHAAQGMLTAYQHSELLQLVQQAVSVESERPFRLWLDGLELTGIIDKVVLTAQDKLILLDYKSNQVSSGKLMSVVKHYRLQLAIYALALSKLKGRYPDHIWLYLLRTGQAYDLKAEIPKAQDCSHLLEQVTKPLRQALQSQEFKRCSEHCSNCIYRKLCR